MRSDGDRTRHARRALAPGAAARAVVATLAAAAAIWVVHGPARTAASAGAEPETRVPSVVRCCLEPLEIPPLACASAILVEAETGTVLYTQNSDETRQPASLVKMMLQLLVYEDLAAGKLRLDDAICATRNAATMGGSQVFLQERETRTLADLLDAVAIASANDASMAIAEHVAGSEAAFVERMNEEACRLGCTRTHFANVHGLDLRKQPRNETCARDLATIACALVRFPRALEISSTRTKAFRGGGFQLDNTNKLLGRFRGLDGLKTGWTPRAGGCFVATAQRDGVRLIGVVLAAEPGRSRFREAERLLHAGYSREPRWVDALHAGDVLESFEALPVAAGAPETLHAAAGGSVRLLIEACRVDHVSPRLRTATSADVGPEVELPVWVDLRLEGRTVATVPARPAPGS